LSVGDGRKVNFQLNFSGGLDRTVSPQCELSSIVAVCHNTISLSRSSGKILFHERATKHFSNKLDASKSEVSKAVGMSAVFKAAMDSLAEKQCSDTRAKEIFAGFITPPELTKISTRGENTVKQLTHLYRNGIGQQGKTEFDLLNAYTELLTHGSPETKIPIGRRFASSEFGNNADSKADFYNLLTSNRPQLQIVEERGKELLATA